MRLDSRGIAAIRQAGREVFGADASVRAFGSRVDDRARGGDLDLFIEVAPGRATLEAEIAFRDRIEPTLDGLRVDVVLHERDRPLTPIARIAPRDGVML